MRSHKESCGITDRILLKHASLVFKEVSSGVYLVIKDRPGVLSEYASGEEIVRYLNSDNKTVIYGAHGTHANFKIPVKYVLL